MWGCPSSSECTDCCTGKNDHRTQRSQETKTNIFFFFPKEHFKAKTVAVNPSAPPAAVWGQIHWFPVSQWTDILPGRRERGKGEKFHSFSVFVWPLQNGSSVIVRRTWVDLDHMSEKFIIMHSVFSVHKDKSTSYTLHKANSILSCHYPSPATRMHVCIMYVVWMSKKM